MGSHLFSPSLHLHQDYFVDIVIKDLFQLWCSYINHHHIQICGW